MLCASRLTAATIRSRCTLLRLKPLNDGQMASALQAAVPDADEAEIRALVRMGAGSPGKAIAFRNLDITVLDRTLDPRARPDDRRWIDVWADLRPFTGQTGRLILRTDARAEPS